MTKNNWLDLKKSTKQMVYFFAYKVAMKYNMELNRCIEKAEDIQWDCIQNYDESSSAKFSTYLYAQLKYLYNWALAEKRLCVEMPDEIYMQIPAPEENNELDVPAHLQNISNAIIMGYGEYFDNDKLSESAKSLKELSDYTGLPRRQVYLQIAELRSYFSRGSK